MTPDRLFPVVNLVALAGWGLLALYPARVWAHRTVAGIAIPGVLAVVYVAALAPHWAAADGGFGSLEQVSRLFTNRWLLLAGWTHYLAFDLLVGRWEVRNARAAGIPHWIVLPCLFVTFMFGPAGWLLYMSIRAARRTPARLD
jgi:hypothetical protein